MEDLMNVASYICNRYSEEFGTKIDEMKLHKLLYFAQRESLIQNKEPLFKEVFYGWRFGPVLKEIRGVYREDSFYDSIPEEVVQRIKPVMDKVFSEYAKKNSWSLSTLAHGELAWKNSRIGISDYEKSDNPMSIDDIMADAERIRERRALLKQFGFAKG